VSSYMLGKKHYPVPYPVKRISIYIIMAVAAIVSHRLITDQINSSLIFSISSGCLLFVGYVLFVGRAEKKELAGLPLVKRFYKNQVVDL